MDKPVSGKPEKRGKPVIFHEYLAKTIVLLN